MNRKEAIEKLKNENFQFKNGQKTKIEHFKPEYAWGIARLNYSVYGEGYPIDTYYLPDEMIEKNANGELVSIVAVTEKNDICGHIALYHSSSLYPGIYEVGQYMIATPYRNTLVAFRLNQNLLKTAKSSEIVDIIFTEMVCNHVITQKICDKSGFIDTAIALDLMPNEAYEKEKSAPGRVSTVLSFLLFNDERCELYIPACYKEEVEFAMLNVKIDRDIKIAGKDFSELEKTVYEERVFDFAKVARANVSCIGKDFDEYLDGFLKTAEDNGQVVLQIYINAADSGVGIAMKKLRERGFFFGGFLPRWFGTDGYLMQKNYAVPDFDSIHIYTNKAKKLLTIVKKDFERACNVVSGMP